MLLTRFKSLTGGNIRPIAAFLKTGSGIVLITIIISNIIRLLSSVTLTRLLDANAFGVVGILSSISFVLSLTSDVGLFPFVVRHKDGNCNVFLDEVWTIRLYRSAILATAMAFLSKPIAVYAGKPELEFPIIVWSATFLIEGFSSMAFATAVRQGQLARLNFIEVTGATVQLAAAIAFALNVKSYWAIIWASLVSNSVKTALSYLIISNSKRSLKWSRVRLSEIWGFSRFITAAGFVSLILSQTDKLVFARLLNLRDFGVYALATSLATMPLAFVSGYTHQVLYPVFSRTIGEEHEITPGLYYWPLLKTALVYLVLVGVLIGSAEVVIGILYDKRYMGVVDYFRILSITPLLAILTWSGDQFCIAAGNPSSTLLSHIIRAIWLLLIGVIGWIIMGSLGLVIAVGTIDIPAYLLFVMRRRRLNALDWRGEVLFLFVATLSIMTGFIVSIAVERSDAFKLIRSITSHR